MKKKIGLIEQIRLHEANKPEVNLEEELSKPYRKPNTDTIICGAKVAEELNSILNGTKNT